LAPTIARQDDFRAERRGRKDRRGLTRSILGRTVSDTGCYVNVSLICDSKSQLSHFSTSELSQAQD